MTPYFEQSGVVILNADCRIAMSEMEPESIDAIVCDPPYGLSFMSKGWDHGVPGVPFWTEALRVLKPGGHLLAFGGTRTFHRLTCAIEDAGFEIRDCLSWLYGSGFPKSHDVSKAIDKARDDSAAVESVRQWIEARRVAAGVTRKSINHAMGLAINGGGLASTWTTNGTTAAVPQWDQWLSLKSLLGFGDEMDAEVWRLNGRKGMPGESWAEREVLGESDHASGIGNGTKGHYTVGGTKAERYIVTGAATNAAKQWEGWGTALKPAWEPIIMARKPIQGTVADNVQRYGTGAIHVDGCRIGTTKNIPASPSRHADSLVEGKYGYGVEDGTAGGFNPNIGRWPANVALDEDAAALLDQMSGVRPATDQVRHNGAFKSVAKGAETPRDSYGYGDTGGASRFMYTAKASRSERGEGNTHPTVKPLALMRWLVTMVTPPDGCVLDPFMGSGTTLLAAKGFRAIGIEMDAGYCAIAANRLGRETVGQSELL